MPSEASSMPTVTADDLEAYLDEFDPPWTVERAISQNVVRPKPPLSRADAAERRARNKPRRALRPKVRARRGHGRPRGR